MNVLLAEFTSPEALVAAAHAARDRDLEVVDAFTPFPVEGLDGLFPDVDKGQRFIMLAGGLLIAGCCYILEWWTAVVAYPFDSGGRPLHSWPVFFLFPFEFGVLGAAICGLITLFVKTGLPRPFHAVFESDLYEHSNADGFLLAVRAPADREMHERARLLLIGLGALAAREAVL